MVTGISELESASNALGAALDEYLDACFATPNPKITSKTESVVCVPNSNSHEFIAQEYPRATFFEAQIQRAKAAIGEAINSSSVTAPMKVLPTEVLTRIFRLAIGTEPCTLNLWPVETQYLVLLTHVCAHWRRIIVGTPLFWTHIDATPHIYNSERLQDRSRIFLERAGSSPLELHISTPYPTDEYWEATGLNEFFIPLIPRIQSLDLDFASSVLSKCFGTSCLPETLSQASLRTSICNHIGHLFIESAEAGPGDNQLLLEAPETHLRNVWGGIRVLRLASIFPSWTSIAYSGLVELSLGTYDSYNRVDISVYHLAQILSSSPELRVLDFGLCIIPSDNLPTAVSLPHLQTLIMRPKSKSDLEYVMRLLTPGSEPLHMAICSSLAGPDETYTTAEIARFFARSNVATLHFVGITSCLGLLSLVNGLQTLTLTIYSSEDMKSIFAYEKPCHLHPKRLHLLSVNPDELAIGTLLQLAKLYVPQRLVVWVPYTITRGPVPKIHSTTLVEQELSNIGITGKVVISKSPNPTEYSLMSF
ncbi:pre-mRNA-processing-splicing factor 8 [Rhizoctonia solani]|uniref:Pre-mRNA-processing-splicing factor 8 n=1 Tax=Rhizoctonia solani TaxID=456999 RepID=A0A8H8SSK2_9AGAM|nr:pre-mRNA-processing-splicing factor 8 [Rhizoctonia solani]QRW16886.1 pre-mRNA-processing-splicing factor 8 [Rhizoctonia solani]